MKYLISSLFIIIIFLNFCQAEIVKIPDPNLERAIRNALNKPSGDLTSFDMVSLKKLKANSYGIVSLEGIDKCTNMEDLDLDSNKITDISVLSSLGSLSILDLSDNLIKDINPLKVLKKLKTLNISENPITDISPLSSLVGITELRLEKCHVSNLSPIASLNTLIRLYLRYNLISNISPLSGLKNLSKLWLASNYITNISPISNLENLTYLDISYNPVSDLWVLNSMYKLIDIDMNGLYLADVNALKGLTWLKNLNMNGTYLDNISFLSNLTNLKELGLDNCYIEDISPLSKLTEMENLSLSGNMISDIKPLENMKKLRILDLGNNQISDISPLKNLTNFSNLGLDVNNIRDISPLMNNPGFGEKDILDLRKNPLNDDALLTYVPAFQKKGLKISFDEVHSEYPLPVKDLRAFIGTSENQIKLQWTNPDEGITRYIVKYNTMPINRGNWSNSYDLDGEPSPGPVGGTETMVVDLPLSGVLYYFAVRAEDKDSDRTSFYGLENLGFRSPVQLYKGWNNVAFMAQNNMLISDALSSISNKYISIWRYNSKTSQWLWHFTGAESFLNNMTHIEPGYGYWLNMKEDCIWDYGQSVLTSPVVSNEKPPFILYGKVSSDFPETLDGAKISLKVGSIEAGYYILGSNPYYQDCYIIEVPLGTLFHGGDRASLLVNGLPFQDNAVTLGGMGTLGKHNVNFTLKPRESKLFQNYPNPFNPETWIPFQLNEGAMVRISIYNSSGNLIKTLDLGFRERGYYLSKDRSARWDGKDGNGESSASGVYFYTIQAGEYIANGKMMLVK